MIHTLTDIDYLTPSEPVVSDEPSVIKNERIEFLLVSRALRITESVERVRDALTEAAA
ncbi:MAG: hypothetical protein R3324_05435 [Halobacteriales archaeon]|nr:hypothetical protein [Halobacteriales archaeon]